MSEMITREEVREKLLAGISKLLDEAALAKEDSSDTAGLDTTKLATGIAELRPVYPEERIRYFCETWRDLTNGEEPLLPPTLPK